MDDAVEESLKKPRRGDFKGQRSETDSNRITNPTGIRWSYTRRVTFSAETAGEDAEYTHKKLSLRSPSLPFISISWTLDLYIPMTTQNLSLLSPPKSFPLMLIYLITVKSSYTCISPQGLEEWEGQTSKLSFTEKGTEARRTGGVLSCRILLLA